jgi:hypothetical protein
MDRSTKFWRKSCQVEALRLTPENIQSVAEEIGAEYYVSANQYNRLKGKPLPTLELNLENAYVGDWVVKDGDRYTFSEHEDFLRDFHTHSERLSTDEKYARVFQIVVTALQIQARATYHGDTDGMDLVAIETTKKLLEEL